MAKSYRNIFFCLLSIYFLIQSNNIQIILAEEAKKDANCGSENESGSYLHREGHQSGLIMVPNPERERLQKEIEELKDQIATFEDQIRRKVVPYTKNADDFLWHLKNKLADLQAQYANSRTYVVEQ